jgi:hypothetical protein
VSNLDFYQDATGLLPGARIFPISPNTKKPIFAGWQKAATSDPAQLTAWAVQHPGCAWAIACAESGMIGVEVDPKARKVAKDDASEQVGLERAEQAWRDLCTSWQLPATLVPHVRSRSGGMHFYFRPPAGIAAKDLKQRGLVKLPGWQQPVIETRVNGFLLIPPSEFEGRAYTRWPGGPNDPYDSPPQLIEALLNTQAKSGDAPPAATVKPGSYELRAFAKYVCKIHHRVGMPREVWRAVIFATVAQYGRYVAYRIAQAIHDGKSQTTAQIEDLVGRAREAFQPGDSTLDTLFKYAHENGIPDVVPKSSSAMFGYPALPLDIDDILAEIDAESAIVKIPPCPVPLPGKAVPIPSILPLPMTGRGAAQARLWAPILARVPRVERTAEHPGMPDSGHPLRESINAAIPAIMADPTANVDALAVLFATHPDTATKVGSITSNVKARCEALVQDAEHALAPEDYTRDNKGEIQRDNVDNMRFFLSSLAIDIRFNQWRERIELSGWEWRDWVTLDDTVVAKLRMRASQTGTRFLPGKDFTWDSLLSLAHDNPVDPACEKLDQLEKEWDGSPRLAEWLTKACGVPADAYHRAVGVTTLLGLVARIRCPGIKFDLMPVFVSEKQGTAKSSLARLLALNNDWFVENVALGESAKELVLLLAGKSVAEISEMRTRGEVEAVKAMISATHDEARPAYGRAPVNRPRRHIFVGTTNRIEFLEDPTGGRRFLPITVHGEIDLDWVRANIEQLVGEAAAMQSRGIDIGLPREVWELAGEHQAAATSKSSAEVLLESWFAGDRPCWISPANLVLLLRHALGRDVSRSTYSTTMKLIGFASKPRWTGTKTERVWIRGEPEPLTPGYGPTLGLEGRPVLQSSATMPMQIAAPPIAPSLPASPLPFRPVPAPPLLVQ